MAKKSRIDRARDLQARFKRLKTSILATDALVDAYYERRVSEIEAFNEDLTNLVTESTETTATPS